MADKGADVKDKGARPPRVRAPDDRPLVTALGGGRLDFSAMLAIADVLPVMIGYVDRDFVLRFVNKPFAEWLGRAARRDARQARCARSSARRRSSEREPMIAAALAGERHLLRVSEFDHPTRGPVALQSDYVPWADADGRGARLHRHPPGRDRAARRRARAEGERGAVPADRQFGAGADVGDPARPGARLRQRGLCRVRLRAGLRPRRGADARLARADPSRRRRPDRRREHRRARRRCSASRSRGATCATTANIAGCGACRSRASGRTGSWSASSGSRPTSRSPRRPSSSFGGRSRSRPRSCARPKRSSARCSRRRSR